MLDLDLSPPPELQRSLWRSLVINLADRFAPERLPPLQLSSKPVDVILPADTIEVPWYRTVFGNIGDVVAPEKLPPLEITSQPVDVGELVGDELGHGWWNSLLQNLRDRLAPEQLAPLELTSRPVAGFGAESELQVLDWSELIAGPKIFYKDAARPEISDLRLKAIPLAQAEAQATNPSLLAARTQLMRDISRTRFRRKIWISLAAAQAVFLVVAIFRFQ